jgi:hypothetical protein
MSKEKLPRRVASILLRSAVRIAPRTSKEWAQAMLTEFDHVEGNWDALIWAVSGVAVLAKQTAMSVLALSAGEAAGQPAPAILAEEPPMRRSTLAAIAVSALAPFFLLLARRSGKPSRSR